jgi:hypothetical protein
VDAPPASPELNLAGRVFEEERRTVEGQVSPTLDEKIAAVDAELRHIEAHPAGGRRLAAWDWTNAAIHEYPPLQAACSQPIGISRHH